MARLAGKRILIMATDGFEESELFVPLLELRAAGAEVHIAAPRRTPIQATVHDDPGRVIRPDLTISDARADDYDALVLPGGVLNPDSLRTHRPAVQLVREFVGAGKPTAAICHGPWLLVEADVLRGKRAACWTSIATDVRNAGAAVIDDAAVVDGNLLTSRSPEDLPAFIQSLVMLIEQSGSG